MNDKMCFACRCEGKIKLGDNLDMIYQSHGDISYIYQCYTHSVELFKIGQANFIHKYKPQFIGYDFTERNPITPNTSFFGSFR